MPRKPDVSWTSAQGQQEAISGSAVLENFELPKSLVCKIARSVLPDDINLTNDALNAIVKGSTVFINYLTASAYEVMRESERKVINGEVILDATERFCADNCATTRSSMEDELKIYRELQATSSGLKMTIPKLSQQSSKGTTPLRTPKKRKHNDLETPAASPPLTSPSAFSSTSRKSDEVEQ